MAGNEDFKFSSDDVPATEEGIHSLGVFVDESGNIFFADGQPNFRIRKVDGATGIITTVAGNGDFKFSGDGGPAIEAGIFPDDVSVDESGNIFIAGGNRIRRVDSKTGIITTVAGNGDSDFNGDNILATEAAVSPLRISLDKFGNIFIADFFNGRIRKVSFSQTTIPTPTFTPKPISTPEATPTPESTPITTPTPTLNITPSPSPEPESTVSPEPSPTPEPTVSPTQPPKGKQFTFNCKRNLLIGRAGLERLVLKLGENDQCTIKLINFEPGVPVEVSSRLRKGLRSAVRIEPARSITNAKGELEITITALHKGVDWATWAIKNEKGRFEFNKRAYDDGSAWGMFVEVE